MSLLNGWRPCSCCRHAASWRQPNLRGVLRPEHSAQCRLADDVLVILDGCRTVRLPASPYHILLRLDLHTSRQLNCQIVKEKWKHLQSSVPGSNRTYSPCKSIVGWPLKDSIYKRRRGYTYTRRKTCTMNNAIMTVILTLKRRIHVYLQSRGLHMVFKRVNPFSCTFQPCVFVRAGREITMASEESNREEICGCLRGKNEESK